ncbi:Ank 2 and KN motif domain containing protein [Trichuris trichiura]|uniref:Ank 2 and KN motif domain containing protein n=1 Tax=Trichuris trichiura TaxID=36087 RepID=A0A077Z183_TRITR|nr:Ank 2 and KN motif domain containing protein [Trichuris trichiura]
MEQPRKTTKCYCCPYGYHIDLDFVKYAENNNSTCRLYSTNLRHPLSLQHARRRSKNLSKYHSTKQTSWRKPGSQEGYCQTRQVDKYDWTKAENFHRRLMSPNELAADSSISSCIFSDSLENLVSDFEETLSRSSGTLPRGAVVSRNDKDYCSDNELEAFRRNGSFRTPAIKASSGRTEGYTSDCAYLPTKAYGSACIDKYRNAGRATAGPPPLSTLTESKTSAEALRSINGGETRPSLSSIKSVSTKSHSGKEAPSRLAGGASMPVFLNLSGEVATDLHNLSNSMRSSESPVSLTSDSCLATSDASNLGQEVSKSVSELLEAVHRHMKHSLNHIEHLENRIRLSPRMTYEMCRIKDEKESLARQWNAAASKELSSRRKGFSSKAADHFKNSVRRGHGKIPSSTSLMDETSCKVPCGVRISEVEDFAGKMRKQNSTSLSSAYAAREHSRSGRSFSSGSADLGCSLKSDGVTESLNLNSFPSIRRLSSGSSTPVSNGRRRFGKVVNYTSDSEIASRSADCAASLRRSKHLLRYPHNDLGNFSNSTVPQCDENIPIAKLDCQIWNGAKLETPSNVPNRRESGQQFEKTLARDIPSPPFQAPISATVSQSITGRHTTNEQAKQDVRPHAVKWDEEKLEPPTHQVAIHSLRLDSELVEAKVVRSEGQSLNSPVENVNDERLCSFCQKSTSLLLSPFCNTTIEAGISELASIEPNRTEVSTTDHATETDNCLCLVCVKLRAKSLVTRAVSTDAVVKVDAGTRMPLVEHTAIQKLDKIVETENLTVVVASKDCAMETECVQVQCAEVNTENPDYSCVEVCTDTVCVADASSEVDKAFLLASGYWKHANVSTEAPLKNSIGFNTDPCKTLDEVETMDCSTSTDCQARENLPGPSCLLQSTAIQTCTEFVDKSCSTNFVAHSCSGTDTKDLITKTNATTNTEEKQISKISIATNTISNITTSKSVCVGTCHEDTPVDSRRRTAETNTDRPTLLDSSSMTEQTVMFSKAVATSLKTREFAALTKVKTMTIGTSTNADPFSESILPEVTDSTFDTDRKKFRLSALTSPLSWKRRNALGGSEKLPTGRSFDSSPASPVANSEDEHSVSKEQLVEDNILPLELNAELIPMEMNPRREEEEEEVSNRLFSLEESQYSDDSALDDDDTEPSSSQGARSPTHKFDITKPRPTRAFHLSKAAAVKKLLTIDKSNRANNSFANGYFRRSTTASSSVRVAKNKGDHLAFIESKCSGKDKQRNDRQPVAPVRGAKGRPEVKKLTSNDDPSSSKKGKAPSAGQQQSSKPTIQSDAQNNGQDEAQPLRAPGKRADKRKFHSVNRQGTVAVSDSETSDTERPNSANDDQNHKRPKAANDLIRRSSQRETLEEALRLLEESSEVTADSVDELQEWARHYVRHTWLKAAARRTADAAQVEKFLKLVETRGQQLLKMVVNISDENDNSALHYSVSHGNFDVVSLLLDCKQCEVDKPNKAGYTPAMLAALSADLTDTNRVVMQRLFQMANVNIRTKQTEGMAVLIFFWISQLNSLYVLQHGQTAIMLAASHGKMDAVTMLIENGADVNLQDEDGSTALMCAAEHGHKEIVRLLLDLPQIDASMVDQEGSTALAIAVENGYKDIGLLIYAHLNHDHSSLPVSNDQQKLGCLRCSFREQEITCSIKYPIEMCFLAMTKSQHWVTKLSDIADVPTKTNSSQEVV